MSHMRLWAAAAIILIALIAGFVLSVPHTRDIPETKLPSSETKATPAVSFRDIFKKGVHTITGTISAPNPCTTVSAEAVLQNDSSGAQNILVKISMPEDTGICLQVVTPTNFSVTISAPAHLPIEATVNDAPASTSVL